MIRFIFKTKDRQGEYLKPEYDGRIAQNGWNHWQHWSKKKVEEWARQNKMVGGWIERVNYGKGDRNDN
jgi:hypothetical protein